MQYSGRSSGLALSLGFTVLLNGLILAAGMWPQTFSLTTKFCFLMGVSLIWIWGCVDSIRLRTRLVAGQGVDSQADLFLAARREYLRGEWSEAERRLQQIIASRPEDVSARLMLATLLRHQGRLRETRDQLRRLQRWQASSGWAMEMRREWELVAKAQFTAADGSKATAAAAGRGRRATRAIRNVSCATRAA